MKHFLMITICVLAALLLVSCATTSEADITGEQSWMFSVNDTDSVDVRLYNSTFEARLWNSPEICIVAESFEGSYPKCYISGSTLLCKSERPSENRRSKVTLLIPESFFAEEWKISTTSGNIDVSQLWGASCEIQTANGNVKLSKCELQELEVGTVSGAIQAEDLICSGEGEFSTTSGSINLTGYVGKTDVSTVSGDINFDMAYPFVSNSCMSTLSGDILLRMPENNGFALKYDTLSGSVRNEFTSFYGIGSGTNVYKNGGVNIEMETLSGTVSVIRN